MSARRKLYNPDDPRDAEELLNILENMDSDDENIQKIINSNEFEFVLLPPEDGNDSDKDDGPSDDEGLCSIRDIGKGVLRQPMEIISVSKDGERNQLQLCDTEISSDEYNSSGTEVLSVKRRKLLESRKKKRKWSEKDLQSRVGKIENYTKTEPYLVQKIREENLQPIDLFKKNFNEEFMQYICDETEKYAVLKGNHEFRVTTNELYIYFPIVLLPGYCKVPFRRMYWETKADTYNALVSNSISRNRFEQIHRYLDFNDNNKIDIQNKIYKVYPLVEHINKVSQELIQPLGNSFSLDEAMEPYYGHHFMKQFIRGKPIRYGFKFWCLTTSDGYLIKFKPYCGAGDNIEGKTLGSSVTESLCVGYLPENCTVYIDNYFTSLHLLDVLRQNKINCVGTIRSDRIEKAPLLDLKRKDRGSYHALEDENGTTLIRWHDNNQVTVATNLKNSNICDTKGSCKRWSKKDKSTIQVDYPSIINLYNQGMGGVDLFDKMRGLYRSRIRSKKWYWPLIRYCINGAVVNMWHLYRHAHPNIGMLKFVRRIVLAILTAPPYVTGPKPKYRHNVLNEVRYDKTDHLIDKQLTQRRYAQCGKCAKFYCIKCNVGLHPDVCFRMYHTP